MFFSVHTLFQADDGRQIAYRTAFPNRIGDLFYSLIGEDFYALYPQGFGGNHEKHRIVVFDPVCTKRAVIERDTFELVYEGATFYQVVQPPQNITVKHVPIAHTPKWLLLRPAGGFVLVTISHSADVINPRVYLSETDTEEVIEATVLRLDGHFPSCPFYISTLQGRLFMPQADGLSPCWGSEKLEVLDIDHFLVVQSDFGFRILPRAR